MMNQRELMSRLEYMLEDSKSGILTTMDSEGRPHLRWMTPVILNGRRDALFTVTLNNSEKLRQISANPKIVWLIQTRCLDETAVVRGRVNILDNPSIKSEVMEFMGDRLTMFWTVNRDCRNFVVLETVIEEAEYYLPLKDIKYHIVFNL